MPLSAWLTRLSSFALAATTLSTSGLAQQRLQYSAQQLNCARFVETAQASILTESAGRVREQTTGRTAVWQFRAEPAIDQVELEGWLDSLELWRKSTEGTIRPDTDGLLGGRYRHAAGAGCPRSHDDLGGSGRSAHAHRDRSDGAEAAALKLRCHPTGQLQSVRHNELTVGADIAPIARVRFLMPP